MVENNFGGEVPGEKLVDNPAVVTQEESVRDLEIDPTVFTPPDQIRLQARSTDPQIPLNPALMIDPQ